MTYNYKTGKLGQKDAKRFLRVASYGVSKEAIDEFAEYDVEQAIGVLFSESRPLSYDPNSNSSVNRQKWMRRNWEDSHNYIGKLSHFHQVLNAAGMDSSARYVSAAWLSLLDAGCEWSYRTFLTHLNQSMNFGEFLNRTAAGSNEDYAREIMELHTLGENFRGTPNYNQADVQASAKVFSGVIRSTKTVNEFGWNILGAATSKQIKGDKQLSSFFGNKVISQSGVWDEAEQMFDAIVAHPNFGYFIVEKFLRFYVADEFPDSLVDHLREAFKNSGWHTREILSELLRIEWTYQDDLLIKYMRPFELFCKAVSAFGLVDGFNLTRYEGYRRIFHKMGEDVLNNIEIFGFKPDYEIPLLSKLWISAETLQYRQKYTKEAVNGDGLVWLAAISDPQIVAEQAAFYVLSGEVGQNEIDSFVNVLSGGGDTSHWTNGDIDYRLQALKDLTEYLAQTGLIQIL
ncbi:MAG: DUF1800 family protein [Bacteroidota bacterium]